MYKRKELKDTSKLLEAKKDKHKAKEGSENPRALRDEHARLRSITVGFRVSPEENAKINAAVAVSGLPKQEYCYRRCLCQDIIVHGNPRVYIGLKTQMEDILLQLKRLASIGAAGPELLETINLITYVMGEMKCPDSSGSEEN